MATFINPTEFTPTATSAWTDLDVSSVVPAGSTGVIVHAVNTSAGALAFGLRNNGSADNRTSNLNLSHHSWGVIGVDSSRIFEAFVGSTTSIDIYVIGYFDADAVFFTNGTDRSAATIGGWGDVNIATDTTGTDVAVAACFEINGGTTTNWGIRKNASSDSRVQDDIGQHVYGVIGVDATEIFEQQVAATTVQLFLNGYIKNNASSYTNGVLRTATAINVWVDMVAVGSTSTDARTKTGGIYELTTNTIGAGLRVNGGTASESIIRTTKHAWGMPQCDASALIENQASATGREFYEIGLFTVDATATATATGSGTAGNYSLALTGVGLALGGLAVLPSVLMPWGERKVA